jgi:hypothetical protein
MYGLAVAGAFTGDSGEAIQRVVPQASTLTMVIRLMMNGMAKPAFIVSPYFCFL